jgi:crossover junction endodeoxyribonuclease RuvC
MKVIAIDPGFDRLGLAVIDNNTGKDTLLHSECLVTDRSQSFSLRLLEVGTVVESLLTKYQPDTMAIETLFFNKNVKTAIQVAEARGALLYLCQKFGCTIYEFSPQEIKIATTGYGMSDKTAVIAMVKRLIPEVPETALDDEYDAIAIGITCLAQYGRGR